MKSVLKNVLSRGLSFVLLTAISANLSAQVLSLRANTTIPNANSNGFLEYLPQGYNPADPTTKYPLVIFLGGIGHTGDGTATDDGLNKFFSNHPTVGGSFYPHDWMVTASNPTPSHPFPNSFTVNGTTHKIIYIAPQWLTPLWMSHPTPDQIDAVIDYAIANYNVDTTRIYLTGPSAGGAHVFEYLGAGAQYANRIAAAVPFTAVIYPSEDKANVIRNAGVAVWAFHNLKDHTPDIPSGYNGVPVSFTSNFINYINNPGPAPVEARGTYPNVYGHDSWFEPYRLTYEEAGLNIFEWMLQFQRTPTTAFAGNDQALVLPANSTTLQGSGTGPNGTTTSYNWQQISGPAAGSISSPNSATTTVNNLAHGNYVFRLSITDNAGGVATEDVEVEVKDIRRIEGEAFSSQTGITTSGDGSYIIMDAAGDLANYTVNLPTAGEYRFRFNASSTTPFPELVLRNGSGTTLATFGEPSTYPYNTGSPTAFVTQHTRTITLPAGVQTLQLEFVGDPGNNLNINFFELETVPTVISGPLPVNFTLFNANCRNGAVDLLWKTAGEQNSSHFAVERSVNGRDWAPVATVAATGTTELEQTYTYRDNAPAGNGFYRIVEFAQDGRKSLGSVIRTNCSGKKTFTVYPNPVVNDALLNISSEEKTGLKITLVDNKGAVVYARQHQLPEGNSQVRIDMSRLPKGTYTLHAQWGNDSKAVQLVK